MATHDLIIEGVPCKLLPEFDGYAVGLDGSIWSSKYGPWKKRKPSIDRCGYQYVMIWLGSKIVHRFIHRLILECFVGPCPEGMECRHYPDPDRINNRLENLSWGTHAQNCLDTVQAGNRPKGELHPSAKLNADRVREIRSLSAAGLSLPVLARKFGISISHTFKIVHREKWKHVI